MRRRNAKKDLIVFNSKNPEWGLCFIVENDSEAIIEELLKTKHIRHYSTYGQLKEIKVKEPNKIPLIDCPVCNNKDVPLIFHGTYRKGDKELDVFQCACCGKVPNVDKDLKIKSFVEV